MWCFVYFQVVLLELNTFCCFWTLQIEFLSGFRKIKQKTNFERVFETQRTTAAVCSCAGFVVLHIQSDGSGYPQEIRTGGPSCIYIWQVSSVPPPQKNIEVLVQASLRLNGVKNLVENVVLVEIREQKRFSWK